MLKRGLFCLLAALVAVGAGQVSAGDDGNGPGLWPVQQGEKWGYIDRTGRVVIPCKFTAAAGFSEGLAAAGIKERFGYIDKTGQFVIRPQFVAGYAFASGMALVETGEFKQNRYHMHELGYINRSGKLVIRCPPLDTKSLFVSYKELYFSEGLVAVEHKDRLGYMDETGKMVIPPAYNNAQAFAEGLAAVSQHGKYGYLDKAGKVAIPLQFKDADPFHEGLAAVTFADDQQGYIDRSGQPAIVAAAFDTGRPFSQGLAAARDKNNKYGFIDRTGNWVIQPQYDRVGDFSEGLAAVEQFVKPWPGNLAYINLRGETVIQSLSTNSYSADKEDWDLHNYRFKGGVALVSAGNAADSDAQVYINQQGRIISPVVLPAPPE